MKMKRLLTNFGITVAVAVVTLVFLNGKSAQNYVPRDINSNSANGMIEWFNSRRVDFKTGKIDYDYVKQVEKQILAQRGAKKTNDFELSWQEMGPDKVGGRTRAILIDKNNTQNIFAGSVSGGLWKSTNGAQTWFKINDKESNLSVSTICQTDNGDIYYGTGEQYGTGYRGNGIYKSTDGINFSVLDQTTDFNYVIKLAAYGNSVYAATDKGLYKKATGSEDWVSLIGTSPCIDVAVGSDGKVFASYGGKMYKSTNGNANSFTVIDNLPNSDLYNVKFDVAPSNPNYVYCSINFTTKNNPFNTDYYDFDIYRSTDGGTNWTSIRGNYIATFQPFKDQGFYDNILKVYPKNENKIILGGIDTYTWDSENGWQQVSYWVGEQGINMESYYLHADQHAIVFHPDYNGTTNKRIFFGNDGGIFISENDGSTFTSYNLKYNVTQFYGVGAGPKGKWLAGAQDNGTQYNALEGSNLLRTSQITGGDGFECAISVLNEELKFTSSQNGKIYRITPTGTIQRISVGGMGEIEPADFYTSMALWETFYDAQSIDSVTFVFEYDGFHVGDTITAYSNQGRRPLTHVLTMDDLPSNVCDTCSVTDTTNTCEFPIDYEIKVWDTYQSLFAYAVDKGVYMSSRALNLSDPAISLKQINEIGEHGHNAKNLVFSKDGNTLFFSQDNVVYKSTNILESRYSEPESATSPVMITKFDMDKIETQIIGTFPGIVTSITTDPEVSNNIIVTLGGYNTGAHIYYSTNAATAESEDLADNFTDVTGNLPGIPVYSSLIAWNNSNRVVVGTEYGIYTTDAVTDGSSAVWVPQDMGLPNVSVTGLFQQTFKNEWENGVINHGYIYAATFGRGVFLSKSNAGPVGIDEITSSKNNNAVKITLYPNPVSDIANVKFELNENTKVNVEIYSISGSKVFANSYNGTDGSNNITINTTAFNAGTYFVKVSTSTTHDVVKMIVK